MNDILPTLHLTGILKILPRSTVSMDLIFHVLERIAVEMGDMVPACFGGTGLGSTV